MKRDHVPERAAVNRIFMYRRSLAFLALLLSLSVAAFAASAAEGPQTRALRQLVQSNPDIRSLLTKSIEQAKQVNPDPRTNPAQNLEQYYQFVDFVEHAIPGSLLEPKPSATLYQRLDQSLGYLYFVCDQPLPELEGRGYLRNSLQYVEPFNSWLKAFVVSWGSFLDTPASWNQEYLRLATADESFGLSKGWYEDPSRWHSFNDFFTRRLKGPDQRPIAARSDGSVLVSPVDGVYQGAWAIDDKSRLVETQGVAIKTGTVKSVADLIGPGSRYAHSFAGGTFTHIFLDVMDYHHYHFPLGGVIRDIRIIPGQELSGGNVGWDPASKRYTFDPSGVGWQALESRGLIILETKEFGLVALLPIGMSPVSSVNFEPILKEGVEVHKGDTMGHFRFGGSDFVLLFQRGRDLEPDLRQPTPAQGYPHMLMGERLGHVRRAAHDTSRGNQAGS
jgi:phosphatidylserine decarboxylase precursor